MSKLSLILGLLFAVFLLTGCSKTELKCRKSDSSGNQIVTFKYDTEEKLENGTIEYEISTSKESLATTKEELENTFKENFEAKGMEVNVTDNGENKIVITLSFEASNINNALGLAINEDKTSIKNLKKELEKNDFICKAS